MAVQKSYYSLIYKVKDFNCIISSISNIDTSFNFDITKADIEKNKEVMDDPFFKLLVLSAGNFNSFKIIEVDKDLERVYLKVKIGNVIEYREISVIKADETQEYPFIMFLNREDIKYPNEKVKKMVTGK